MKNPEYSIVLANNLEDDSMNAELTLDGQYFMQVVELNDDASKLYIQFDGSFTKLMDLNFFKQILLEAEKRITG